jgi:ferric-chelate reductase
MPVISSLILFQSFLAAWVASTADLVHDAFNPDNPFYTWAQVENMGNYYAWLGLGSGAVVGIVLIPVMLITALPVLRRNSYNTFYYIHVIFAVLVLVFSCIHASTNFYFVLPGLLLWVYDWSCRMQNALYYKLTMAVESAGNNWYRMRLASIPEAMTVDTSAAEKGLSSPDRPNLRHPLETYYIQLSTISKVQIHPFTAAATATSSSGPSFLFQKSPPKKKEKASHKEWTWLLGAMVDQSPADIPLNLEVMSSYPDKVNHGNS